MAPCVMLLMQAAFFTPASGRGLGPGNRDFFGPVKWHRADRRVPFEGLFWAKMAHASLVAISGPKKASIFRIHPFQWPSKWIFPHQNHYVQRRISTGTLIVNFSSCECSNKQHLGVSQYTT